MGSLFGGGGQEEQSAALANATRNYEQYRPDAYQAQMNSLNNAMSAYQGANNALQTLWGAKPQQSSGMPHLSAMPKAPATPMGMMTQPPQVGPNRPSQPEADPIKMLFDPLGIF